MYALIYRWRLHSGMEDQFRTGWASMTHSIRQQCGSYGSRLHECDDGTWVAYALWPSRETSEACNPANQGAAELMAAAVEERFETLRLTVKEDLIERGS